MGGLVLLPRIGLGLDDAADPRRRAGRVVADEQRTEQRPRRFRSRCGEDAAVEDGRGFGTYAPKPG